MENKRTTREKLRTIAVIFLAIGFSILIWFLPEIRKLITDIKRATAEEIITGTLKCTYLDNEDDTYTTEYVAKFLVDKNQTKKYRLETETKADEKNNDRLVELNENCKELSKEASKKTGIEVTCSLRTRVQNMMQLIDLDKVSKTGLTSIYEDSDIEVPEYTYNEDARVIRTNLKRMGYNCTVN